jgi:hypothetical protein
MRPPSSAARPARRAARAVLAAALAAAVAALAAACADDPSSPASAAAAPAAVTPYPWAHQPDGAPTIADVAPEASLEFPPGTRYGEALTELFVAVRDGGLPAEAVVRDPLPPEVVYAAETGDRGLVLSLTAPWGWASDTRAIRAPSVAMPGDLTREEALAVARAVREPGTDLPEGVRVDVPRLPACQVQPAEGERPPCP